MKALIIAFVALILIVAPAMANQCPMLISQLEDAVAKMNANDSKLKEAKALIVEAQKLHDGGRHAESVAKADAAAQVLGVRLNKM